MISFHYQSRHLGRQAYQKKSFNKFAGHPGHRQKKIYSWTKKSGITLMTLGDTGYPALLKNIPQPPLVLYVAGNPDLLSDPQVAIVGSRRPSHNAVLTAKHFAQQLTQSGLVVTSGLAQGIDCAAHQGALLQGSTIAVLGTGIDVTYPKKNQQLAQQIAEYGALVTEFPPQTPPKAFHFPLRNRIISGLTQGVLVVEANQKSGSLITANLSAEFGREVFAMPGSIHNPTAKGCHLLIKQGAKLTQSVQDILEELPPIEKKSDDMKKRMVKHSEQNQPPASSVLQYIDYELTTIDQCVCRSGLKVQEVTEQLLQLELANYINRVPGGYVRAINYESNQ